MKIFINSYGRADLITTPALLDASGIPYTVVLHSLEEAENYNNAGLLGKANVVIANQSVGLVNMRNWILENLVDDDEWYLLLDDNIKKFTSVSDTFYHAEELPVKKEKRFKEIFECETSATQFMTICEETIAKAEWTGAKLAGFASNVNFYFREKKWREVGYVIGKTQLIKKTDLRYDLNVKMTDDYLWTAQNLVRFGRVLINNYAVGIKKHYMVGGIGPYESRLKYKLPEVEYLMRRFPGLFRFKIKKNHNPKSEILLNFTSLEQVYEWRLKLSQLNAVEMVV